MVTTKVNQSWEREGRRSPPSPITANTDNSSSLIHQKLNEAILAMIYGAEHVHLKEFIEDIAKVGGGLW